MASKGKDKGSGSGNGKGKDNYNDVAWLASDLETAGNEHLAFLGTADKCMLLCMLLCTRLLGRAPRMRHLQPLAGCGVAM